MQPSPTPKERPPAPAGPYSTFIAAGEIIFLAGQGPLHGDGSVSQASFEEQARLTFSNLEAAAKQAGLSLDHAVRVGVYLTDMGDFAVLNEVYREFFKEPHPARTTIQSNLPGFRIEADAVLWAVAARS
jgi:2-iminobutanoate/2-iminopropanoate deaminase